MRGASRGVRRSQTAPRDGAGPGRARPPQHGAAALALALLLLLRRPPEPPLSRAGPGRASAAPMSAGLSRAALLLLGRPPAAGAVLLPGSWRRPGALLPRAAAPGRALGTHPKKEPMEALNTAQGARDFIYSLHASERSCLLRELHRFESIAIAQGEAGPGGVVRARPVPSRLVAGGGRGVGWGGAPGRGAALRCLTRVRLSALPWVRPAHTSGKNMSGTNSLSPAAVGARSSSDTGRTQPGREALEPRFFSFSLFFLPPLPRRLP